MAYSGRITGRQRLVAGGGALLIVIAVGVALMSGFNPRAIRKASEAISAFALPAAPPREESKPASTSTERESGKASAANLYARAAPVAAPEAEIVPPKPPPIAAAPQPGAGQDASAGAAPDPGPGSGAGGTGAGTGAGAWGNGTGGGTKAVWRSGTIRDRDYPRAASAAKIGGEVEVRFTIQPTGRATDCRVARSSGDTSLDATTCRLIEERFRFRPATNSAGAAIASPYGWRQSWWLEKRR